MKTKIFISDLKMAPHRERDNNEGQKRDTYENNRQDNKRDRRSLII